MENNEKRRRNIICVVYTLLILGVLLFWGTLFFTFRIMHLTQDWKPIPPQEQNIVEEEKPLPPKEEKPTPIHVETVVPVNMFDLVGGNNFSYQFFIDKFRNKIQESGGYTVEDINQIVRESLNSFVLVDSKTIRVIWREKRIEIPVSEIDFLLRNDYAKSLLNLPPITYPSGSDIEKFHFVVANPSVNCLEEKCIALTFDDGPGPYTNRLLDILKEQNLKATFFVVGSRVERYQAELRRAAAEGHELGNHSWDHSNFKDISLDMVNWQIYSTNRVILEKTGIESKFSRPPYGAKNEEILHVYRNFLQPVILWSVIADDWKHPRSDIICNRITNRTFRGSIILLHDINVETVDAMPCIIKNLSEMGYKFVPVSTLLGEGVVLGRTYSSVVR